MKYVIRIAWISGVFCVSFFVTFLYRPLARNTFIEIFERDKIMQFKMLTLNNGKYKLDSYDPNNEGYNSSFVPPKHIPANISEELYISYTTTTDANNNIKVMLKDRREQAIYHYLIVNGKVLPCFMERYIIDMLSPLIATITFIITIFLIIFIFNIEKGNLRIQHS